MSGIILLAVGITLEIVFAHNYIVLSGMQSTTLGQFGSAIMMFISGAVLGVGLLFIIRGAVEK